MSLLPSINRCNMISRFADKIVNTLLFYMNRENEISWMSVEAKAQVKATAADEGMNLQKVDMQCPCCNSFEPLASLH